MTEDILKRLNGYNESRARMGDGEYALCVDAAEEIAKLRALLSRWVKAVAHHKLSAEKAERERDEYKARDQAEGGAASPAAFESDAVPDFPARGDNFDTVSRGVELGDWIPTA